MSFDGKNIAGFAAAYTSAWNTGSPQNVAAYFAEDGEIVINRGTPWRGRAGIAEMAAGFFADVAGMKLTCDAVRGAGSHVVYLWTFTGHAARTGNALTVHGWEEWEIGDDLKIRASRGWYDAPDYARQVAGGGAV
ncbi:MAG: nuclear transport factor 2 family protein [Proteobacteria bacterium]|nr:nuclear transport factor 2 family protein [Pseudomonadota bacterium]